jgi:hypothetical protein
VGIANTGTIHHDDRNLKSGGAHDSDSDIPYAGTAIHAKLPANGLHRVPPNRPKRPACEAEPSGTTKATSQLEATRTGDHWQKVPMSTQSSLDSLARGLRQSKTPSPSLPLPLAIGLARCKGTCTATGSGAATGG